MIKFHLGIHRNSKDVDRIKVESEIITKNYLVGQMTAEQYFRYLKDMDDCLDFRRLASDIRRREPQN
jgi:hypothetical protein